MRNNITREDLDVVIAYLQQEDPKLTQSSNVAAFEEEWSNWLGVKYSVFVNSGSSANQLTMAALRLLYPEGGEVIVPPLTWSSDIASVLQCIKVDPGNMDACGLRGAQARGHRPWRGIGHKLQGGSVLSHAML